jgi:hypothetical protein
MLARLGYDPVGLMPVLCGQLAMPLQYLFRREQFLAVSGAVRRDLRGSRSIDSRLTEMIFDLFAPRAGCRNRGLDSWCGLRKKRNTKTNLGSSRTEKFDSRRELFLETLGTGWTFTNLHSLEQLGNVPSVPGFPARN